MQIDHIVWFCPNLADGERHFGEIMNCEPRYGGVHAGEGTRNSLLSLSDTTYLEILSRDPAQEAERLDPELATLTDAGIYHWAVGGADLAAVHSAAAAAGLKGSEVVSGGRTRPDGISVRWKLFGIRDHGFGALVPFFIDWLDSEHPARSAPRGGSMKKLEVYSPRADQLQNIYGVLGIEITVVPAREPGLFVTVESRAGENLLPMSKPVPRGFII